jgi:hypothetical protein
MTKASTEKRLDKHLERSRQKLASTSLSVSPVRPSSSFAAASFAAFVIFEDSRFNLVKTSTKPKLFLCESCDREHYVSVVYYYTHLIRSYFF